MPRQAFTPNSSSLSLVPPSSPGRLQLLPPVLIIAEENIEGSVLTQHDLRQFADFLALEFKHDQAIAATAPDSWYQEQVGAEICSDKEAALLREMTIERCTKLGALRGLLAKSEGGKACAPSAPWWERYAPEVFDLLAFAFAISVTILVLFLVYTESPQ